MVVRPPHHPPPLILSILASLAGLAVFVTITLMAVIWVLTQAAAILWTLAIVTWRLLRLKSRRPAS